MLGKGKRQIYIKHKMSSCFKNMPFKKLNPSTTCGPPPPCLYSVFLKALCTYIKYTCFTNLLLVQFHHMNFDYVFLELQYVVYSRFLFWKCAQ